jgi:hypothetical protein
MTNQKYDQTEHPPFETKDLRKNLKKYLELPFEAVAPFASRPIGQYRWGVYAFFDYDDEPIYVGQTKEKVSTPIRRHLTNQRTDAVAMSVLDPFEVHRIEVWPLPQFQETAATDAAAKAHLDALENKVYLLAIANSTFNAVLNEKDPPPSELEIVPPKSLSGVLVSEEVYKLRAHPDFRIARRALIISRLSQVISERKVQGGLRRVLVTHAKRLEWLASRRFEALGGNLSVQTEDGTDDEE